MLSQALWKCVTRTTPAISCALVIVLLVYSFLVYPFGDPGQGERHRSASSWQWILCLHILFLHILSLIFPVRTLFALNNIISRVKESGNTKPFEKGVSSTVVFAIVIPAYKEDVGTLARTLNVLASHAQARCSYHIYLALEEREANVVEKANTLIARFEHRFSNICFTLHPSGLPLEAPGKSSNEAWAAQQIRRDYALPARSRHVIVTIMDADTHLSSRFFEGITREVLQASPEDKTRTLYMAPLVFDRNLHDVPLPVRTADVMWACAGISSLYRSSQVCIPTSVYALPLELVEKVGGWDSDYGAIGEDLHMYLKCFFSLSGNLIVKPIYAAASQCNVSSDSIGMRGYAQGLLARYSQALRHMWGALDTGFAIRQAWLMIDRSLRSTDCRFDEGDSYAKERKSAGLDASPQIHYHNVLTVFHRLFEAHFLPLQLALCLTTSEVYNKFYPAFLVPLPLRLTLQFCAACRIVSFLLVLAVFKLYEQYHRLCVGLRCEEMRRAGLLEDMEDDLSMNVFPSFGLAEAALFPIGGFAYGVIPALQATLSHIFTERLVYKVSLKPQFTSRDEKSGGNGSATPSYAYEVSLNQKAFAAKEYFDTA